MTLFERLEDDFNDFDGLLSGKQREELPDWLLQEADFEPVERTRESFQALVFEHHWEQR